MLNDAYLYSSFWEDKVNISNRNKVNISNRKKYTTKNENEEKDSEIISIEENSYKRCILSKESKTKTNRNSQKKKIINSNEKR